MGDEIVVRGAQPSDGRYLAGIWLDVAKYYAQLDPDAFQVPNEPGLAEWFEDDLKEDLPANWRTLVADVRGDPAGWVIGHVEPPHPAADRNFVRLIRETRLIVEALVVAPHLWRHGIGSRLMSEVEAWGRSRGATLSTLDTYVHSPVSVPFYEKRMGYERRSIHFVKHLRS
jgi:GNAT superfamily N-acetyltransferase